jgi:hypothetical protein
MKTIYYCETDNRLTMAVVIADDHAEACSLLGMAADEIGLENIGTANEDEPSDVIMRISGRAD